MKITKAQIQKMIKEELAALENNEQLLAEGFNPASKFRVDYQPSGNLADPDVKWKKLVLSTSEKKSYDFKNDTDKQRHLWKVFYYHAEVIKQYFDAMSEAISNVVSDPEKGVAGRLAGDNELTDPTSPEQRKAAEYIMNSASDIVYIKADTDELIIPDASKGQLMKIYRTLLGVMKQYWSVERTIEEKDFKDKLRSKLNPLYEGNDLAEKLGDILMDTLHTIQGTNDRVFPYGPGYKSDYFARATIEEMLQYNQRAADSLAKKTEQLIVTEYAKALSRFRKLRKFNVSQNQALSQQRDEFTQTNSEPFNPEARYFGGDDRGDFAESLTLSSDDIKKIIQEEYENVIKGK